MVDTWPENPHSARVTTGINWNNAHPESFKDTSFTHVVLSQIPVPQLKALKVRHVDLFALCSADVQEMVSARIDNRTPTSSGPNGMTAVEVTSVAGRLLDIEAYRASIPIEGIINVMLASIHTGLLGQTPLSARDKIDVLKFLANKVLPDAKTVDVDDRSRRTDRRAAPAEKVDLGSLTREELLEMLQHE